ncbi:MAG: hypothetical protein sL5_06040 [Candidatus Mesenet longicola]|uniref:Uncharacterized protein n=1 Tax=Candidatus Mesenet longicola TaxID=1892558 RepID=A0A8J3HXZ3_9RICK|nr:MAG: hypothetical protein sGL2_06140 [Candidatus Mesenet longicola]GHM59611.1 MAG: hypothetical protein sL5_06040 [Candidatus Mesenet longicola]
MFLEILQFPRRSRKFISKVFANDESLNCFKLFLNAHKKNEKVYSRDNIKNIFIDLTISKDETKLIKLLLDNDIPIYSNDSKELSIKRVLNTYIDVKKDYKLLEKLLSGYKDKKIKATSIQRTFSFYNVSDKTRKCNDLKEIKGHLEFIDFLSKYFVDSVGKENIGKIFSYDDTIFNKIKNEDNRELLKLLLQHQTTYSVDKIKDIFSFDDDIFNKIKKNLKLTGCLLKYKFDVSDIKYFFSEKNSCFEAIKKNPEQIIKYVSDHKLNFADIKEIDINEDESSIKLRVPKSQLDNSSTEGFKRQQINK